MSFSPYIKFYTNETKKTFKIERCKGEKKYITWDKNDFLGSILI